MMAGLLNVSTAFRAFHILLLFLSVRTIPLSIPDPEVDDMVVASDNLNLQKNRHRSHFYKSFNVSSDFGFKESTKEGNSSLSKEIEEWLESLEREIDSLFNGTAKGFDDSFFDSSESKSSEGEGGGSAEKTNAYAENI